jgi:hypothetical protein
MNIQRIDAGFHIIEWKNADSYNANFVKDGILPTGHFVDFYNTNPPYNLNSNTTRHS